MIVRFLLALFLVSSSCGMADTKDVEIPQHTFKTKSDSRWFKAGKKVGDSAVYLGSSILSGSVSLLAGAGWTVCKLTPWTSKPAKECLVLSKVCGRVAFSSFKQIFKKTASQPFPLRKGFFSHSSWYLNQQQLRQIPAFSKEDTDLLIFLQRRWLAKNTGYYSSLVDWLCPSFGISMQVHPESMGFYARDPSNKLFQTYTNRVKNWKLSLPHPSGFPLILTRPSNIQAFLPRYIMVEKQESAEDAVRKLACIGQARETQWVLDLTQVLPGSTVSKEEWINEWNPYQDQLLQSCEDYAINPDHVICIQRIQQTDRGGIRLLPFYSTSNKWVQRHHQFLLEWLSKLGLTANRVELDRLCDFSYDKQILDLSTRSLYEPSFLAQESVIAYLQDFDQRWQGADPQKTLMVKGMVETLKGLLTTIDANRWEEIMQCPTRSAIVHLSCSNIKRWLQVLEEQNAQDRLFDTVSHLEQVYAHIMPLVEIFSPFTKEQFSSIFHERLTSIPDDLKDLTSCGIHSSGMTSLTYIFKAVEKSCGGLPRILYGENIYFENIHTAERVASVSSVEDATEDDWKEANLILAQFNPALKRIQLAVDGYRVEKVEEFVHRALKEREEGKPLVLALDCTFDFINSQKVENLLLEFKEEISLGKLNVICYRSGIKFDLFGMDNYCGAPVYMIHNQDSKWDEFDALFHDPALVADLLSLNWFCLAYQYATPYLEGYRKQIFDNTRALLDKMPARLLSKEAGYRVIPIEPDAEPGFVDIKIFGPLHEVRGGVLVGGLITLDCMQKGHPLFYRPSVGFYHPNLSILFSKRCTTVRLTLGLDPDQVDVLAKSFKTIDSLND